MIHVVTVDVSWQRVVAWLRLNAPATAALIRPPATPVDLAAAQSEFDLPWPADLVRLYELNDGLDTTSTGLVPPLFGASSLSPLAVVLSDHASTTEVYRQQPVEDLNPEQDPPHEPAGMTFHGWLPTLIPFSSDSSANNYVVDPRPGPATGCVCEWVHDDAPNLRSPSWPSVTAMVTSLADSFENGTPFAYSELVVTEDGYLDVF